MMARLLLPILGMKSHNGTAASLEVQIRREIDRYNARLRHCSAVSAQVLEQANKILEDLWEECQDPRTAEEILDSKPLDPGSLPCHGWPNFLEKLHLLGYYLEYSQRLLMGNLGEEG